MATTDTCVNIIYSEPIIPHDQDHPTTTSPTIIHVSFQHRSTPWSVCGEPWSRFGQFWRDLVKTWSNLWSSTCIRFLTVAVDSTIREKTVTEVGWLSRSRAMLQMTDSAGSTNSGPTSFLFGQNPEREHCRMLRQNSGLGIGKTRVGLW